jgi:thymidylate kinase
MKRKLIVYFAGIDGSGKTTVAESLCESLRDNGLSCKYLWCGWRGFESPLFKPIASRIKKTLAKRGKSEKAEEAHNTLPLFGYLTFLDYFMRVYPNVLASHLTHDIVIVDRYVYDVMAGLEGDKQASRFLFALFRLFPRPSIVFFISVPPEVAYNRKDDITSIDFLRHAEQKNLNMLAECSAKVVMLDGTQPKNELRDRAFSVTRSLRT